MSWMWRGTRAAVAASLLALAGCGSDEEEKPWDGKVTPLAETADWKDTGPYAACKVNTGTDPCSNSPASFNVSACRNSTLAALEREGIYRLKMRYELPGNEVTPPYAAEGSGSLRFSGGTPDLVQGLPLVSWSGDPRLFSATGRWVRDVGTERLVTDYTLMGCAAPSPRELTGCFATCTNGQLDYVGTFHAERMTWGRSEPESSGGLKPVSESYVELGSPVDIYVAKDHAYVVSINRYGETGGLTVFDVKDRAHPVFKTSIQFPGDSYWNGVWAKGDALYVASADTGLLVFDISDPGNPVFLRSMPTGGPIDVHTVLVDGDRLYAMSPSPNRETLIFDVTTPRQPVLLTRHVLNVPGYPHDAFVFGDRLYVSHLQGGYQVLDVKDPAKVRNLGSYAFPGTMAHHSAVGRFGEHTLAFEGGERMGAHLRVLKVDDPTNIVKVGEFSLRDVTSIHNILLVGTRLYIAWYHEGVRVLDVSNPTKPKQVAHFNTFHDTDPRSREGLYEGAIGIRVPGDGFVYVVDDVRGLLIFPEL
ncbi:hypothetical protein HPC49_41975 [Pyxidicoccus fallax]|uniref:Lipoprotein n=1 Tax=Pyxidicoccus fallax TaxID=394095 RepID=A0A848LYL3_9BACT|nr:hypothetical protein [Pyxidicoccus fallax]NMO22690.1 hypothetical protein [Pyxidicoccus fallax]NPC84773.1 hypothetical protein [Pyxidicoccus fallax]